MKPGDVIIANYIRQIIPIGAELDFSARKEDNFVFIFLGSEPKDGSDNLDPIERLKELGWELNEQKE